VRICIVGASGKLGIHMVEWALDRGDEVVAVCREQSVGKLAAFGGPEADPCGSGPRCAGARRQTARGRARACVDAVQPLGGVGLQIISAELPG
jgi:nucleoside-diphosphate-sugar epimerase